MKLETVLAVGFGGFIGANLRLYLNGLVNNSITFLTIPLGTLTVNLLGSFLIGFLFSYIQNYPFPIYLKTLLITGFLGALTTFSTFAYESLVLLENGKFGSAFINIGFNLFGTIFMAYLGTLISAYYFGTD